MSQKSKTAFFVAAFMFSISFATFAQTPVNGFYAKKNQFTLASSYTYKSYDKFYRGETLTEGTPTIQGNNMGTISSSIFSVYAEYGILDWLSTTVTLPYITTKNSEGVADPVQKVNEVSGLQDLSIFFKARAFEKVFNDASKLAIGGALGVSFPVSDYSPGGILSLGHGATAVDGTTIIQYNTNVNIFAEAQIGYSIRESSDFNVPNAFLYSFKLGYYNDWIYAHAKLGTQNSISGYDIGSPEFGANGGPAGLPQTKVDYTNLNLDVYFPLYKESIGVSAGYGFNLDGRNYNKETSFSVGLVYRAN